MAVPETWREILDFFHLVVVHAHVVVVVVEDAGEPSQVSSQALHYIPSSKR